MCSRKILWGLACLTVGSLLLADKAHADRRTGLGGNLLIQDPDDLFPFPQYTLQHRNMIRLDYGGSGSSGNGVLTLGDSKQAFGVALHRGDLLSPDVVGFNTELQWLGGVGNPFNVFDPAFPGPALPVGGVAAAPVLPATVVDLSYARAMGNNALGVRFGFGRGIQSVKEDGETSKGSATFFAGQVGYSILPPQGLRVDLSGNVVASFGKSTVAGEDQTKGFDLRVGALGRGYYPINSVVDVGFLGHLSFDNERLKTLPGTDTKNNDFGLSAMAGVGPAIHVDRAQVAAYGGFVLGAGKTRVDAAGADDNSRLSFAAPMVNMATEVQVLDWLFVRTSAQYTWQLERFKGDNPAGDTSKERVSSAPFAWSVGLGAAKNNFFFDGVIRNAFVINGPNFIGGNANGFMAMASMTYKFGDVFDAARSEPAAATSAPRQETSAPVVEPVVEPPSGQVEQELGGAPNASATGDVDGTTTTGQDSVQTQGSLGGDLSLGR